MPSVKCWGPHVFVWLTYLWQWLKPPTSSAIERWFMTPSILEPHWPYDKHLHCMSEIMFFFCPYWNILTLYMFHFSSVFITGGWQYRCHGLPRHRGLPLWCSKAKHAHRKGQGRRCTGSGLRLAVPQKIECFVFDVPMLFGDVLLHDPGRVIRIRCISKTCKNGHCFMKTR